MSNEGFDIEKLFADDPELLSAFKNISAPGPNLTASGSKPYDPASSIMSDSPAKSSVEPPLLPPPVPAKVRSFEELLAEFETPQPKQPAAPAGNAANNVFNQPQDSSSASAFPSFEELLAGFEAKQTQQPAAPADNGANSSFKTPSSKLFPASSTAAFASSLDERFGNNETAQPWKQEPTFTFGDNLRKKAAEENTSEDVKGKDKKKNKAINIVLNILTYAFIIALIVGSTMFAFSNNTDKHIFGYRFYHVLTPSMSPTFNEGDMIFIKIVDDPATVKKDDIVTFQPSPRSTSFLTHRVVELLPADDKNPARMITQGDANNAKDPPVRLDAVIGIHVFTVPYMGGIIDFMRNNLLLMGICFGATLLLISVLRVYFSTRGQTGITVSGAS
jgi:signal peptidase